MGNVTSLLLPKKRSQPTDPLAIFVGAPWIYVTHCENVDYDLHVEVMQTLMVRSETDIRFTGEWHGHRYPLRSKTKMNLFLDKWSGGRAYYLEGTFPETCQGSVVHIKLDQPRNFPAFDEYSFVVGRIEAAMSGKPNVNMAMLLVVQVESMESEELKEFSKEIREHVKDKTNFRMVSHLKDDMDTIYRGYEWFIETTLKRMSS